MDRRTEQYPDPKAVRAQARQEWEDAHRHAVSIQERIGESVPWWLVLIAVVFFALSVPHTMEIFGMITPYVGWTAPFGIEFGLLYAAFRRKQNKRATAYLVLLEILLFVTAVIVNGAGSFFAVVDNYADIAGLSISELLEQYPTMPATHQVALLLAPIAAVIIPIGTAVAGEGLAALFLERRQTGNLLEREWQRVGAQVEFEALRDAAIANGVTPGRAVKWAESIVSYERPQTSAPVRTISGQPDTTGQQRTFSPDSDDATGHGTGHGYTKRMDARTLAENYLHENPDAAKLSVREFGAAVGIGKTTAADVLGQWKSNGQSNGHGGGNG